MRDRADERLQPAFRDAQRRLGSFVLSYERFDCRVFGHWHQAPYALVRVADHRGRNRFAVLTFSYLSSMARDTGVVFLVSYVGIYRVADGWYHYGIQSSFIMKKTSFHIVRVGLAITFLWIGVLIIRQPEAWGGYLEPWAAGLVPVPLEQAMWGTAFLDIVIGILFLIDWKTWFAGLLAAVHLVIVLTVSGITDITVRDIGLLAAALAVLVDALPLRVKPSA